mgnify:CR=1 FL=1
MAITPKGVSPKDMAMEEMFSAKAPMAPKAPMPMEMEEEQGDYSGTVEKVSTEEGPMGGATRITIRWDSPMPTDYTVGQRVTVSPEEMNEGPEDEELNAVQE